jgi:hypothetical protein
LARRIRALTNDRAAAKNQLHATDFNQHAPKAVLKDLNQGLAQLDKRIALLIREAVAFIKIHKEWANAYTLLISVKGIADTKAVDPRRDQPTAPGTASAAVNQVCRPGPQAFPLRDPRRQKTGISKAGNGHLCAVLYMPTLSAKRPTIPTSRPTPNTSRLAANPPCKSSAPSCANFSSPSTVYSRPTSLSTANASMSYPSSQPSNRLKS